MKRILPLLVALLSGFAHASHAKWTAKLVPADARAGESAQIVVNASIAPEWHVYQLKQVGGPTAASFQVDPNKALTQQGDPVQPAPKKEHDPNFGIDVGIFENAVAFGIPVQLKAGIAGEQKLTISLTDQTCNAHTCDIPEHLALPVSFSVSPGPARPDRQSAITTPPEQPAGYVAPSGSEGSTGAVSKPVQATNSIQVAESKGLLIFLWLSFLAGLAALATPCVFPMIPITVSYFSKTGSVEGKSDWKAALAYSLGIVSTFTLLGLAVAYFFGATGIQNLATNLYLNLALAVVFVALGLSLFGLFELKLPSAWVNKASAASNKGGIYGAVLMGLTFTLTSFTCTAPFVGTVLFNAAQGEKLYPLVGMVGFSTAFALPFFFLAMFPGYLAKLPKSGSWLNIVKGFMAFVEIGFALKFLSNADLVLQLGVLTRPVFLAVWAIVATVASLYLFGLVRVGEGGLPEKLGSARIVTAVLTLVLAGIFLDGIGNHGRSLGELTAALLPPDPYPGQKAARDEIQWVSKYSLAMAEAKAANKSMFLDFTGVTCTNCRAMEEHMFVKPEVRQLIEKYVPVQLYTDRPTPDDRFNQKLEVDLSKQSTLPMYVIVSPDGKPLKFWETGFTDDTRAFVGFLESGMSGTLTAEK